MYRRGLWGSISCPTLFHPKLSLSLAESEPRLRVRSRMSAQPYRGTVRIRDVFPSAFGEEIRQRSVEAAGLQQGSEPILVEHRHTQRLGLVELRSGVVTGYDIVGPLRHRAHRLATGRHYRCLDFVEGERRQRTCAHGRPSL